MNSWQGKVVLDTDVTSHFHEAGALKTLLGLWHGTFVITSEVLEEIDQWPGQGPVARAILDQAIEEEILSQVWMGRAEFRPYAMLRARVGRGEAASIAIAGLRGYAVGTDDATASRLCAEHNPPVAVYRTEDLLGRAVADGRLERGEAEHIWSRMKIADPNRRML